MESFLFAINAVSPIIITVAIGYILKKKNLISKVFSKTINKLVFRFFLPVMLFMNVYNLENFDVFRADYIIYTVVILLVVFFVSIPFVMMITKNSARRGTLLQACFRSNYGLVGIPLAGALYGTDGTAVATILSIPVITLLNVLAVVCFTMFDDENKKINIKKILVNIVKNPLIQSAVMGILIIVVRLFFEKNNIAFRLSMITPLMTVADYLSGLATPLALLMLGVQFEFSAVKDMKKEILFGSLMRGIIVPLLGVGIAYAFFRTEFSGAVFASLVAVFVTPVSVSTVPMTQELKGDITLAGQLVIWTTLVSALTIFFAAYYFYNVGIFA